MATAAITRRFQPNPEAGDAVRLLEGVRPIGTFGGVRQAKNAAGRLAHALGDSVAYWVATFEHTHYGVRSRARAEADRYTIRPVNEPNELLDVASG